MTNVHTRRNFLRTSIAVVAGAAGFASQLAAAQEDLSRRFLVRLEGDAYWRHIRDQFAFTEQVIPINAANLCPSFREVAAHVTAMTADIDQDCSFNNRAKFSMLLEEARSDIANQLKVSADEIALVRNTSEANNVINNGLELGPGDEVIVWSENHPTNNVAWDVRAARFGFTVTKAQIPANPRNPDELLQAFTRHFSSRTRVLALTHVSNVSGIRLPIAELVSAAHTRNIHVHVDGAQTWGAMALDLRALGLDSFTASAHKWYMGPKEAGLLYIRKDHHDRIWPGVVASGWGEDVASRQLGARKFESLGQRDDAALAALGLTAKIHQMIGPERIEQRTAALAQRFMAGVRQLGLPLVTPTDPVLSFGVCIVAVPDGQAAMLANRLYEEHGIAGAATGGLRFCPAIYNTEEHIDRALAGLRALLPA